jgi:hypothetical protein
MTNTDQTPLPTAKESADEHACVLYTHMQHDSGQQMISMQRICGQNHLKAAIMREYNPVYRIITAKSPNKFKSRTCRENLTTAYGNHVISTGGKIQIKHGGTF